MSAAGGPAGERHFGRASFWRAEVLAPAAVLFAIMLGHALLETARDALFLARLGPDRLAWAYLAIAGAALIAVTAVRKWAGVVDPRRSPRERPEFLTWVLDDA